MVTYRLAPQANMVIVRASGMSVHNNLQTYIPVDERRLLQLCTTAVLDGKIHQQTDNKPSKHHTHRHQEGVQPIHLGCER